MILIHDTDMARWGIGSGYGGITGPRGIVMGQYGNAPEAHEVYSLPYNPP